MILFFGDPKIKVFAIECSDELTDVVLKKLSWLFSGAPHLQTDVIEGSFIGSRLEMVTPWSTNAVEITQNMNIKEISRIEEFFSTEELHRDFDPMLHIRLKRLDQSIFDIDTTPTAVREITDINLYNKLEGLSLNVDEIAYLENLSVRIGRSLTDSEIFGFSQVNSEHCRHKIFNGTFVIDGKSQPESLFDLIKKTSRQNPENIVSAYMDNVAFIKGPVIEQLAPQKPDIPSYYVKTQFESVISIKAETHNFPTTVEPFNGAATGSGGEIRDRLAGGRGSLPLAGTAVYMTPYPGLAQNRSWERAVRARQWLYQTPEDILIKASNGASDFGNKFGQPLITGSLLTFEHEEPDQITGFDKVVMLAGGVGYAKSDQSKKCVPKPSDRILVLGGDNYRIGMGGAAVSSADTGAIEERLELNAVQRSNPEMQKRVANTVRALVESRENPIVSIHDHGAGGHLNCLSELVEKTGGKIDLSKLPIGDKTLSAKELIGNESQERMGVVISHKDKQMIKRIADRERSPMYDVGHVTGDKRFTIASSEENPIDLNIEDLLGNAPEIKVEDTTQNTAYEPLSYDENLFRDYLEMVLQIEAVACKDWLTNKVDRCVTGRVAKQQCVGSLQLPLNNVGVVALDYRGKSGIATSIGHAPISALINPISGSRNAIAEALTNIVWAPLENGLKSVSLSANWMWPCKNKGEDARLYKAVEACSDFVVELGINIPTGKDSLSMTQKYPDKDVKAPGTVIISAAGHCNAIDAVVEPVFKNTDHKIYYLNLSGGDFKPGGSSFAQILSGIGDSTPTIESAKYFAKAFDLLQLCIKANQIVAGHDISSGGLITTLLELCFSEVDLGADIDLTGIAETDCIKLLFSENSGVVFQATEDVEAIFERGDIEIIPIGTANNSGELIVKNHETTFDLNISQYRDVWYKSSYLLDCKQSGNTFAKRRFDNYKKQPLTYKFPQRFDGKLPEMIIKKRPKAAVLREKGSNSEREMANSLHLAGFDVKDVHMTDLVSGRENLMDIDFLAAVGGFSNSDVLGSAKGWAGTFLYNPEAKKALTDFFEREDTLSLGICNGCQLFMELGLINPTHKEKPKMSHNASGKFECSFTSVEIQPNNAVMMRSLEGARLGIWSAHGEGKFNFPYDVSGYNIVGKFGYDAYPANPNGSDYNAAMLVSDDGRHLVSMPHFERSLYPWNWAYYPQGRDDKVSPWFEAFENAKIWLSGA